MGRERRCCRAPEPGRRQPEIPDETSDKESHNAEPKDHDPDPPRGRRADHRGRVQPGQRQRRGRKRRGGGGGGTRGRRGGGGAPPPPPPTPPPPAPRPPPPPQRRRHAA